MTDKAGNRIGESKNAAKSAITKVALSRICMAVPGMGNTKNCSINISASNVTVDLFE